MRKITIRVQKHGIEVCTHPELEKSGAIWISPYQSSGPYRKGQTVDEAIKAYEKGWRAKAEIVSDYRGLLAPKERIVMKRFMLKARTDKFTIDVPLDGIIYWEPPNDFYDIWHAWGGFGAHNKGGYGPNKKQCKELIPILNSITGGKWAVRKGNHGGDSIIMYEWDPDEKKSKGVFDFEDD